MCIYTFVYKSLKYFQKKSHTPRLNFFALGKGNWLEREGAHMYYLIIIYYFIIYSG